MLREKKKQKKNPPTINKDHLGEEGLALNLFVTCILATWKKYVVGR